MTIAIAIIAVNIVFLSVFLIQATEEVWLINRIIDNVRASDNRYRKKIADALETVRDENPSFEACDIIYETYKFLTWTYPDLLKDKEFIELILYLKQERDELASH